MKIRCRPDAVKLSMISDLVMLKDQGSIGEYLVWLVEIDDRLHIVLGLEEETTDADLNKAIPYAFKWRDWLQKHQGTTPDGHDDLMRQMHEMHKTNTSYALLAKNFNERLEHHVRQCVKHWMKADMCWKRMHEPRFLADDVNQYMDAFHGYFREFWTAHSLASAMHLTNRDIEPVLSKSSSGRTKRLSHDEIRVFICSTLNDLKAGENPFSADRPVSNSKMREQLAYWRKKHGITGHKSTTQ